MALIEWENYYSVGISIIDKQHQKLIIIINDLADAMRQGKGREITKQIINDLKNYTLEHFTTEENYFKEFDYPDTEEHIKEHHDFIDKVNMFQTDFEAGKIGLSVTIMHFFK